MFLPSVYDVSGGTGDRNCVVLNDIHIDIMDYIIPASCTDTEFRQMWAEFEWENKVIDFLDGELALALFFCKLILLSLLNKWIIFCTSFVFFKSTYCEISLSDRYLIPLVHSDFAGKSYVKFPGTKKVFELVTKI